MLNRDSTVEGLPDGSGKPGEGFVAGLVPDLERTAGRGDEDGDGGGEPQKRWQMLVDG